MKESERWMWAGGILVLDFLVFFVPVAALFAVFVILSRPPWFKDWIARLYE